MGARTRNKGAWSLDVALPPTTHGDAHSGADVRVCICRNCNVRVRTMYVSPTRLRMSDCCRCVTSETVGYRRSNCSKVFIPGRCNAKWFILFPAPISDSALTKFRFAVAPGYTADVRKLYSEARRAPSGRAVLIPDGSCQTAYAPRPRRPDPCVSFGEAPAKVADTKVSVDWTDAWHNSSQNCAPHSAKPAEHIVV